VPAGPGGVGHHEVQATGRGGLRGPAAKDILPTIRIRRTTAFLSAAGLVLAAGADAARAPVYVGTTAPEGTVLLRLSTAGTRVDQLRVTWRDSCARRRTKFTELDRTDRLRVRDGRFRATRRYVEAGTRRRVTFSVSGRLTGRLARGTFAVRATKPGSRRVCRTGTVRWSARRVG
jgi:hypothetical protein